MRPPCEMNDGNNRRPNTQPNPRPGPTRTTRRPSRRVSAYCFIAFDTVMFGCDLYYVLQLC